MSRAVVTCPSCGRPEALRNTVRAMPRSRAIAVMRAANASSLPATFSASATAASLPDATIAALMACRTVITCPAFRPNFTGLWPAA